MRRMDRYKDETPDRPNRYEKNKNRIHNRM